VTITLPHTLRSYMSGCEHPIVSLAAAVVWAGQRALGRPVPPRMILELNSREFRITERGRTGLETGVRSWPRAEVGELRPNRYSRGLLVRIPGRDNFDILGDCGNDLVHWLGDTLAEAMRRTQSCG
jgi:hypothetical protein